MFVVVSAIEYLLQFQSLQRSCLSFVLGNRSPFLAIERSRVTLVVNPELEFKVLPHLRNSDCHSAAPFNRGRGRKKRREFTPGSVSRQYLKEGMQQLSPSFLGKRPVLTSICPL